MIVNSMKKKRVRKLHRIFSRTIQMDCSISFFTDQNSILIYELRKRYSYLDLQKKYFNSCSEILITSLFKFGTPYTIFQLQQFYKILLFCPKPFQLKILHFSEFSKQYFFVGMVNLSNADVKFNFNLKQLPFQNCYDVLEYNYWICRKKIMSVEVFDGSIFKTREQSHPKVGYTFLTLVIYVY